MTHPFTYLRALFACALHISTFFWRLRSMAFILLFVPFAAVTVRAQLEFDVTRVELNGVFGQETLEASYPFENRGQSVVTVADVQSGCGCTVPELEQKVYVPGQKGTLRAVFNVGQRQGEQRQTITVVTDKGTYRLQLVIKLPVRLEIAPRILLFRGAETGSAEALLHFSEDLPVTIENIVVSDAAFSAEHEWLSAQSDPAAKAQPHSSQTPPAAERLKQTCRLRVSYTGPTDGQTRALVQIHSKGASGKRYTDYLHLRKMP